MDFNKAENKDLARKIYNIFRPHVKEVAWDTEIYSAVRKELDKKADEEFKRIIKAIRASIRRLEPDKREELEEWLEGRTSIRFNTLYRLLKK